ncbi:Calpain-15 [Dictyocoela muelleri]|nr:Calpain-15 [Dictyocoela muelleri]
MNNNTDDGIRIYQLKAYWDGFVLLVENRNSTKNVHFHFRCTSSQNASISRIDSNHQLFDVIPSMHRPIIVTIARENASHSVKIERDFQTSLSSQNYLKYSHLNKETHSPVFDQSSTSIN